MEGVIINKAKELFFTYGFKSVSMDDLAKGAGVSKKTIYQLVADKSELVEKVVDDLARQHAEALIVCRQQARDAVEEVLLQARIPFATIASVNVSFFYELEKFFPFVWEKMKAHKEKDIIPAIVHNLERGIAEEYYRKGLDFALLADIRVQQLTNALNPRNFTDRKTDTQALMNELTRYYLHSIVTTKGTRLLNKYL